MKSTKLTHKYSTACSTTHLDTIGIIIMQVNVVSSCASGENMHQLSVSSISAVPGVKKYRLHKDVDSDLSMAGFLGLKLKPMATFR